MHIPDGFLSPPTWGTAAALSGGYLAAAVRRLTRQLEERQVAQVGIMTAFIFAAQMLNFPVAPGASGHFLGGALAALLFGPWQASLMMTVILVIQAFVFLDGGITALGANVLNMAVIAPWVSWGIVRAVGRRMGRSAAVFLAAWCSVVAAALACGLELSLSGAAEWRLALSAMAGWHVLIGIGEGLITMVVLTYLRRIGFASGEGGQDDGR